MSKAEGTLTGSMPDPSSITFSLVRALEGKLAVRTTLDPADHSGIDV